MVVGGLNVKKVLMISFLAVILSSCHGVPLLKQCPPNTIIEWVDVLMIDDIKYEHYFPDSVDESLSVTIEKGEEIGQVTYKMADHACSNHKMQNGHAAHLEEGTVIYEVTGYPSELLVMANNVAYIAQTNKQAKTVGELYPMDQLVKNIYIESLEDGRRIHTFSQSSKERFLNAFYLLPLGDWQSMDGERVFLEIELNNGVSFRQLYWADSNVFHNGAVGNDEVKEVIQEELAQME